MKKEFGLYLRTLREERGISARRFAQSIGMDASNFSKIERGEVPPPSDAVLGRFAEALGINIVVDERWYELKFHADASRGDVPEDVMARPEAVELLPALFAYLRKEDLNELKKLIPVFRDIAEGRDASTGTKKD